MKITELKVANFKRIELVEIQRGDGPAIIAGRNAQGKSSTLDALNVLLWGKSGMPPGLARTGTKGADLRVAFDNGIVIERKVSPSGLVAAKITTADGMSPAGGPQAWLDERLSKTACDPLALLNLPAGKLAAELSRIVGLNTRALDAERAQVYAQRTAIGRLKKDAEGALASLEKPDNDTPIIPVSSAAIAAEIATATQAQTTKAKHIATADECSRGIDSLIGQAERAEEEAAAMSRDADEALEKAEAAAAAKIIDAKENRELAKGVAAGKTAAAKDFRERAAKGEAMETQARADAEAVVIPDVEDAQRRLSEVDTVNAAVASKQAWIAAETRALKHGATYAAESEAIEALDEKRREMLAAAEWPVDGLSIEDGKVTLQGHPIENASQAERLRFGVALALAGDPEIPVVLVRDGSLLDDDSMELLADAVAERGGDLWIERVGTGDAGAIVIEDGRNVEAVEHRTVTPAAEVSE